MTTASASATPIEHGDPYIRRKNWITSLSNKNNEILEDLSKFSQQRSQALTAINSQLETISPHLTNSSSENHIDNLMNSLKSKQRRENFHQPSSSVTRLELSGNAKDLSSSNTLGMEDGDGYVNETKTILEDNERHSSKSNIISNKDSKSDLSVSGGELDWKYLAAENHNSDSEEQTENLNGIGEKNEEDKEIFDRRRNKANLTINTNPTITQNSKSNRRPITPESSDSEFDISTAHIEFAPSLLGKDSSRVRLRSVSDVGFTTNRSRPGSMTFNSVDEVIEEEVLGSLSDSGEALDTTFGDNVKRPLTKSLSPESGRKRVPTLRKYSDDFGIDDTKLNKAHRKFHDETPFSTADIADDNSSVRSDNSFMEELGAIKSRLKRLELEQQDDASRTRRVRRPTGNSDTIIPPSAISPGSSSQGGASNSTTSSRQFQAVQHQKHLQNAFEFFEKAFATTDQLITDTSPPPTHSMAMVVYSVQQLNHKLRVFMSQADNDSEKTIRDLLKASDEQIRSLTECLLALPTLLQKTPSLARKTSAEREYQYVTRNIQPQSDVSHLGIPHQIRSTRSVSPRLPVSREEGLQDSNMTMDSSQRISPIPPATDQSSPPMSYYGTTHSLRRSSNRTSIYSEYGNETQPSIPRTHSLQERHTRHFSGSAHASMSGTLSSSPPLPHAQNNQYEQPSVNHRPRLSHRYSSSSSSSGYVPSPTTIQRPLSRVSTNGYVRSEENSPHPLHYPVPIPLRTSSRAYNTPRAYDQIRRYQSDPTPQPMERERRYTASSIDLDGRFERRASGSVNDSLQEVGYNGTPIVYGDNSLDRKFVARDRNTSASEYGATGDSEGLRRSVSNGATYRKSLVIYPSAEVEVEGTGEASGGGNVERDNVHGDGNGDGGGEGGEGGPNDTNVEKNETNGYI